MSHSDVTTYAHDTIAALATPAGIGGIAVIRISGTASFALAESLFRGGVRLADAPSHTVHYGTVSDPVSRETLDTVLVTLFRNPHSFTGEDVVEISAHGGYLVSQRILSLLYRNGARPAAPGEFTLRAFLNGKMDLAQAEAVADIIHARTEKAQRASVTQLSGKLSAQIRQLREQLINLCSLLELELDFSQEGIELADKSEALKRIESISGAIRTLTDSYQEGKVIKEGISVALVGKPNAGKSSLLNVLLQEERAIVSEIPGTTRDTIEERILLEGVEFIFKDTAGLRDSSDTIEQEGIRRTSKAIASADVILLLVDGSQPLSQTDVTMFRELVTGGEGERTVVTALNKKDIRTVAEFDHALPNPLWVSCKSMEGIPELKKLLVKVSVPHHDPTASSIMVTNVRHKEALDRALGSLENAASALRQGMGGDFAAVDLHAALNYLGEIIGLTTPDDILNNIFSKFCIGK